MRQSLHISILALIMGCASAAVGAPEDKPSATTTEAAKPLAAITLEQLVQKAVAINPLVTSREFSLQEAQATYTKAKRAVVLPKLDLTVTGGIVPDTPPNVGPAFDFPDAGLFDVNDWGPFVLMRLEALQPIYTFGKISNLKKAAAQGVKAGEEDILRARNEIVLHAKKAYFTLANLFSYLDFVEDLINRSQKAADIVKVKLAEKSTEVTDIDLMQIEIFQLETKRRKIGIVHNIEFVKMTIKILMGLPRDTEIDIADHRIRMDDKPIDDIAHFLRLAQGKRPELKQLDYLVASKKFLLQEKNAQLLPSFGVSGQLQYGRAPGRQSINNPFLINTFNQHSAGGALFLHQNLSLHLLDADRKKAKAAYAKSQADQQAALQAIEIQIRNAHQKVVAMYESFEHSKAAFKKVRSWVLATTLNFGVGVVPPKDLVEAFVAYSKIKNEYLDTLYDYKMAMAELRYAVGEHAL